MFKSLLGVFLTTTASAMLLPVAGAQAPDPASTTRERVASDEDIVVTARRRVERLQDVPVPVTALDAKVMESTGVRSIETLGAMVPGLNVGQSQLGAGGLIYLRGVGSGTGNALIDQSVAVSIDNVAMASASLMFAGQYDNARVEVLRGPQSLFFGKNSPGGVISFTSKDPGDEFEAEIGAGYELEAKEAFGSVMLSGPLTDQVGARLFVRYSDQEGYYDAVGVGSPITTALGQALPTTSDGISEASDLFVRGTLTFDPTDALSFRAKATYSNRRLGSYPIGWQRVFCPNGSPTVSGNPLSVIAPAIDIDDCRYDRNVVTGDMSPTDLAAFTVDGVDANGGRHVEIFLGSLEINYEFGNGITLTSVSGYYTVDDFAQQDQSALPTTNVATATLLDSEQFTQEFRLSSDWERPVNFLTGVLVEQKSAFFVNEIPAVGRFETSDQDQWAYSVFGQVLWDITSELELSVGARYTHEEKELVAWRHAPVYRPLVLPNGTDQISFHDFSPELTLSYRPSSDLMFFASYKEGFKSGGYDASGGFSARVLIGVDNVYEPEYAEGFEGGFKAQFWDRQLTLNVTGFTYDYTNLQVTTFDSNAVSVATVNAAGASVDGIEFDTTWRPENIEGLTIRAAGLYLEAVYSDFISDCYTGQSIAAGCNIDIVPGGAREGQDKSGKDILQAPTFSGSLAVSYETLFANDSLRLNLSSDIRYSDGYETQQQGLPGTRQSSFYMLGASVAISDPDEAWEIAVIGRNLNDELITNIGQSVPLSGARTGTDTAVQSDALALLAERGRSVMLQVRVRPSMLWGD